MRLMLIPLLIGLSSCIPKQERKEMVLTASRLAYTDEFLGVQFISNYDGDTLMVELPGLPRVFGHHISVRVKHVDTPEMMSSDPCARAVAAEGREKVGALLRTAKTIDLINVDRDKYFRILAEVRINGTLMLHEFLIDNRLAIPYEGDQKSKINWCPQQ